MPRQSKQQIEKLLKDELGFSDQQVEIYVGIQKQHHNNITELNNEIRVIKKEMFDRVLMDDYNAALTDSLLNLSSEKQLKIETLTLQYFLDLKKICNKDQEKKLMNIMHRIFGPPHISNDRKGPPLPPLRDHHPSSEE